MFLICIPLYFYFVMMGIYLTELQWTNLAGKLTLAQILDVIFLIFFREPAKKSVAAEASV